MGFFLAFLIGLSAGVMVPRMKGKVEDRAVSAAGDYLPISKVKCPTCLKQGKKSHSMVTAEKDDLQKTETEYRCTRGHEWTLIVEKESDK